MADHESHQLLREASTELDSTLCERLAAMEQRLRVPQGLPITNVQDVEALAQLLADARQALAGAQDQLIEQDITEHKRMEDALRESETRYRNIFESLQDVYFRIELPGYISMVSPSVEVLTGQSPEQFIGRPASEFLEDPVVYSAIMEKFLAQGFPPWRAGTA